VDGNVSGKAPGCSSAYAGRRNSRSRRGDSVLFVASERDASASVCRFFFSFWSAARWEGGPPGGGGGVRYVFVQGVRDGLGLGLGLGLVVVVVFVRVDECHA